MGVYKGPVNGNKPIGAQQSTAEKAPEDLKTVEVEQKKTEGEIKEAVVLKEGDNAGAEA